MILSAYNVHRSNRRLLPFFSVAVALLLSSGQAALKLAPVFGDHAVLQRDQVLNIWGIADPGEEVKVAFAGQEKSCFADEMGRWLVHLDPMVASRVGRDLVATSNGSSSAIRDLLIGDVWFCSGQSNMARTIVDRYTVEETGSPDLPSLRQFTVPYGSSLHPLSETSGFWEVCAADTIRRFSSVGYFFAREIHARTGVPIGLIQSAVGGTRIEAWMPAEALAADKFMPIRDAWSRHIEQLPASLAEFEIAANKWAETSEAAAAEGKAYSVRRPLRPEGNESKHALSCLYNAMVNPLTDYRIRGILWYQGEYNTRQPDGYAELFASLIASWRHAFKSELPFYWVQLANHEREGDAPFSWAKIRDAQTQALSLPHTGQAVTIDIGEPDDIHPRNKWDVGGRLARIALVEVYGESLVSRGPNFMAARRDGAAIRVLFADAAGLHVRGGSIDAFEIAGADGIFHPAKVKLAGSEVIVSSPQVTAPSAVRYAWSNSPRATLYNQAGLPAVPFTFAF
ncbi:MAG: sialate O-acetylesterase [Opitutae bacterium]|nr:sialate O-acetylesterase [Opitutae bacterium]